MRRLSEAQRRRIRDCVSWEGRVSIFPKLGWANCPQVRALQRWILPCFSREPVRLQNPKNNDTHPESPEPSLGEGGVG